MRCAPCNFAPLQVAKDFKVAKGSQVSLGQPWWVGYTLGGPHPPLLTVQDDDYIFLYTIVGDHL